MNKPIRNILCFDHYSFDMIMDDNNWIETPPTGVSCVSICAPSEGEMAEHWFKKDCHVDSKYYRIFNLDIDDTSPFWFGKHENYCYDKSLELYLEGKVKLSNAYFSNIYISGENKEFVNVVHALDYQEAFDLVKWIDYRIKHDDTFYIHCAVGASRSQGVVRYIYDVYRDRYDIKFNENNPNNTYNPHVVMMLKRAYWKLFLDNEIEKSFFETEPQKFNSFINIF